MSRSGATGGPNLRWLDYNGYSVLLLSGGLARMCGMTDINAGDKRQDNNVHASSPPVLTHTPSAALGAKADELRNCPIGTMM
jgi:hypothetical protein